MDIILKHQEAMECVGIGCVAIRVFKQRRESAFCFGEEDSGPRPEELLCQAQRSSGWEICKQAFWDVAKGSRQGQSIAQPWEVQALQGHGQVHSACCVLPERLVVRLGPRLVPRKNPLSAFFPCPCV